MTVERPDVIVIVTDQERAAPPYEPDELTEWRRRALPGARWFEDNGVSFGRHYTGSLACVPSRPTMLTGHYPDVHGVTQTDGLGKMYDDSRMRWLRPGEVPTLGHWFRAAGYDTHYDGKWHLSHADLVDESTGQALATNDDDGVIDRGAVQAYLDADPLGPFGFSGWVGPEPHGPSLANTGFVRDPLLADRVVAWLEERYARRRAGDADALRPFLLVAGFVNPHDIVFAPVWLRRGSPLAPSDADPPPVPPSPTDDEDLSTKPAAQIAYRASYPSTYGLAPVIERTYRSKAQAYRDLYHRLHAEVDGPLDRVRRAVSDAVSDGGSTEAVLVRTADHGELLGAHGGLHQKWFNLYDEATRVPFVVARIGPTGPGPSGWIQEPTSHVDLVPTLLGAAGVDREATEADLRRSFTEVHRLPGRDLMALVDGSAEPDADRAVYLLTRDNMPEGDSGASGMARRVGRATNPPLPLRIQVPAHVAGNHEGLVVRVAAADAAGGGDRLWKIVRSFDDPATWTEPGVRHLAATGPALANTSPAYRTEPLPDQWELYDLDTDPIETDNRWHDPTARPVFDHLVDRLGRERAATVPARRLGRGLRPRDLRGAGPARDRGQRTRSGHRRGVPRPPRAPQGAGPGRSAAGRRPAGHRGDRQAGPGAWHLVHPAAPRNGAATCRRRVRERHPVPGSTGQPLGGRRQSGHRPEPERGAHGGQGDAAAGGRYQRGVMNGIFDGVRVVEFAQNAAIPHCGRLLAGLGADVVKVEPPEGDAMRHIAPLAQREGGPCASRRPGPKSGAPARASASKPPRC